MTSGTAAVALRTLAKDDRRLAASLTARAMRDNPTAFALHGAEPLARLLGLTLLWTPFFRAGGENCVGAYYQGCLVGVAGAAAPGTCIGGRPPQAAPPVPGAGAGAGPGAGPRAHRPARAFEEAYRSRDLPMPHWHVAPVAVEPGLQGRGIGASLMAALHRRFDAASAAAWCETDTGHNVAFYQANGWRVADQASVEGVDLWWLRRDPEPSP